MSIAVKSFMSPVRRRSPRLKKRWFSSPTGHWWWTARAASSGAASSPTCPPSTSMRRSSTTGPVSSCRGSSTPISTSRRPTPVTPTAAGNCSNGSRGASSPPNPSSVTATSGGPRQWSSPISGCGRVPPRRWCSARRSLTRRMRCSRRRSAVDCGSSVVAASRHEDPTRPAR